MKKILSILIVLLFICAAFFVFTGFTDTYERDDPQASPIFSIGPIFTTLDFIVHIPDANLNAALHTAAGVPPANYIVSADLKALTGGLNLADKGISNLEGIQFCSNITALNLDRNNISSLLPNMSGLSKLTLLSMEDNNLTSVQAAIGTMPKLSHIKMSGNPITSVDGVMMYMMNIKKLELSNCALTSFPSAVLHPDITYLNLSYNSIDSIPAAISGMTSLYSFYIGNNNIEHLPDEICNMASLQHFNVSHNKLYDLPANIGNANLYEFSVQGNRITRLPPGITDATFFYGLNLSLNRLTSLPSGFDSIVFEVLYLEYNFLDVSPGSSARNKINNITANYIAFENQLMPVTNLAASPTDTEIVLTWDACTSGSDGSKTWDVEGYTVFSNDSGLVKLADLTPGDLTYTHSGLNPEESHEYWVGVNYFVSSSLPEVNASTRGYSEITTATTAVPTATPIISPSASAMAQEQTEPPGEMEEEVPADNETNGADETNGAAHDLETDPDALPTWAIVLISIFGTAALGTGVFFGVRMLMRRTSKPPKGGSSGRSDQL